MCIGIPAQVIECLPCGGFEPVQGSGDGHKDGYGPHYGPHVARCNSRHGTLQVDLSLVGAQPAGTWLLVFLDAAREVIDAKRAAAIDAALDALAAAENGATDFSAFFADLDREPQLPEFLRAAQ